MSKSDDENPAASLARDDAGIECAAVALCWAARPGIAYGPLDEHTPRSWWQRQSEMDQRLYLYRARVTCAAWERYWQQFEE